MLNTLLTDAELQLALNTTTKNLGDTLQAHHLNPVAHATLLTFMEEEGLTIQEALLSGSEYGTYRTDSHNATLYYVTQPAGFWRSTSTPEQLKAWDALEEALDTVEQASDEPYEGTYPFSAGLAYFRNDLGDVVDLSYRVRNAYLLGKVVTVTIVTLEGQEGLDLAPLKAALKHFKSVCPFRAGK